MNSPYSNFHLSVFKMNAETFYNIEQYIQADKAASCNDDITKAKIMMTKKTHVKLKIIAIMLKISLKNDLQLMN